MARTLRGFLAGAAAVLGGLLSIFIESPVGLALALPKLLANALAPYTTLAGAVAAVAAWRSRAPLALVAGTGSAVLAARYVRSVTRPHAGFETTFGADWRARIPAARAARMLSRRWYWRLPPVPAPRWQRNLAFWTLGDAERDLLCDIWQPPAGTPPSGLAVVYFHGSAWHFMDKDFGTRTFFRHLAAQGHVVMDVAYRLAPEVDIYGMLGDVKRAVAWMKTNGAKYNIDPGRVVLAGASAGGHLALLAAYTPCQRELKPDDVGAVDMSVRGVISYYGPTDLPMYQDHYLAALGSRLPPNRPGLSYRIASAGLAALQRVAGERLPIFSPQDIMLDLMGGPPDDLPEAYRLMSPISHVDADCPPTLLFHGSHDTLVPVEAGRALHRELLRAGVPAVYVEFPQTEHGFDIALWPISQQSPPAQAALYDVERFLALLA